MYNIHMKLGIFGGTFNPPHNMHVKIAEIAKAQLSLDRLIVMPCGIPPHKTCGVAAETRLALAKAAFEGCEISDYEISKAGASYTVETLRHFKTLYPEAQLFLIIGGDSFENFDKWYMPKEIATLATLAVADRASAVTEETRRRIASSTGGKFVFLDIVPNGISSTEIRLRYQFGMDNAQLVPQAVDKYVLQHNLYAEFRETALKLRGYLTEQRLRHTFYVVKRGLEFAREQERDKVFLACLLHDCAKYIAPADYAKYGFVKPSDMPDPVVHSFLGECVAKQDFGVRDEEVLSAIAYHTTGRPDMTRLEKIVYVADKTEETRPYPLEHLLRGSLDDILKACLEEANSYKIARHGREEYALSRDTLRFYLPNNYAGKAKK